MCKQKKLFAFVNKEAHYSLDKAANILGIGTDNLIKIDIEKDGQMNIASLSNAIEDVKNQDGVPFFVCATLGTTVRGAYDNISELLELRDKHNFWLHGDGAWGGAAIMSDKLKSYFLVNVENIDSFTMDFHKMLGTNLMCNFLLVNHQNLLIKTCADGDNSYIFRDTRLDPGHTSLQCGRRVDSLKWFLDWKFYSKEGFAERVESYYELSKFVKDFVTDSEELEIMSEHVSFNVCFRFKIDNIDANDFNQSLRDSLCSENIALLSLAYIGKNLVFRLLISNVNINKAVLIELLNIIIRTGKALANDKD